jgi:nucleotidyltransferase-like protein
MCNSTESFLERFRGEAGESLEEFIGTFAFPHRVAAVILGGSIPLGVATSRSDVDLLVLVDDDHALKPAPKGSQYLEMRAQSLGEAETLTAAEMIAIVNGVEVNLLFIVVSRLVALWERLSGSDIWVSPSGANTAILGRIKAGWVLSSSERFQHACSRFLRGNSLELHCTVSYLVGALQDLEDARAALSDNLGVALHLGRSCVEAGFFAHFASTGLVFVGSKWLRLLDDARCTEQEKQLAAVGMPLLFPPLHRSHSEVGEYLRHVAAFVTTVRSVIEKRAVFRVAFALCPQLYDPQPS